ncbi:MAG: hypothetical protein U9N63_07925, partial [Pseudomonadota bacterium]|nr:hypothetical protein [Pseudomonadota bacterium]
MQNSYGISNLRDVIPKLFALSDNNPNDLEDWRTDLLDMVNELADVALSQNSSTSPDLSQQINRCASTLRIIFSSQAEKKSSFCVVQALFDITHKVEREDLQPAFYAELVFLF